MIAPAVITGILVVYYVGFGIVCALATDTPVAIKVIFGVIPLALAGVSIYVLRERIKEIRSGEEDDLSQY